MNDRGKSWEQLIVPAPVGIAALSQLLISASRASDFQINKIDNDKIPLVRHPESFRKTLTQIANDAQFAFIVAHNNMIKIHLEMDRVPDYVRDSIEIIHRRPGFLHRILVYLRLRPSFKSDLMIRLEKMKITADNGLNLSTEVSQAFDHLGQLNQQVLMAITASHGAKEQEIENVNKIVSGFVKSGIQVGKNQRLKANQKEQEDLENQLKDAQKDVRLKKQQLEETSQIGVGDFFGLLLAGRPYAARVSNARNALSEAENQLQKIETELKRVQDEKDKIFYNYMKTLKIIQINIDKELSQNDMIKLLENGMGQLSQLNSNWAGFTNNFNSFNNNVKEVTQRAMADFAENAKSAQGDISIIDFLTDSMNKTLETSQRTSHNAKKYVKFSNENIMQSLDDMDQYKDDSMLTN